MTINASLTSSGLGTGAAGSAAVADAHHTHDLGAAQPPAPDTASLLDHRTRHALVPIGQAPAGHYLEAVADVDEPGAGRPCERRLIPLSRPIIHVGRGLVADVRLADPHVSRRHAIIALRGDGARVLDDRSANGTFVNGRPVTIAELSDGDIVRVGRAVFRYLKVAPVRRRPLRRFPIAPARRSGPIAPARRSGPIAPASAARCAQAAVR
jgi:hypothetical protein